MEIKCLYLTRWLGVEDIIMAWTIPQGNKRRRSFVIVPTGTKS